MIDSGALHPVYQKYVAYKISPPIKNPQSFPFRKVFALPQPTGDDPRLLDGCLQLTPMVEKSSE